MAVIFAVAPVPPQNYLYFVTPTANGSLFVYQSTDGQTFGSPVLSSFPGLAAEHAYTPCVLDHNSKLWMVTLQSSSIYAQQYYLNCYSLYPTGLQAYKVSQIDFSSVIGTGTSPNSAVWSAKFFVDPADNSVHLYAGASNTASNDGGFKIYETHPTDTTGFTTWSGPVLITGSGFPGNMIDPEVFYSGSTYYMWYKNEDTKYVELASGTGTNVSSVSWTVIKTGDWAGWGVNFEAPDSIQIGSNYEILLDAQGAGIYYSILTGGSYPTGTWGTKAAISASISPLQHGNIIQAPSYWVNSYDPAGFYLARTGLTGSGTYDAPIRTFINGLVSNGLLSTLDFLHLYCVDTQEHALMDIIGHYDPVTSGTETFTVGHGFAGDASTGYIDSNFRPSAAPSPNFVLNSAVLGFYGLTSRTIGESYCNISDQNSSLNEAADIWPFYSDGNCYSEINANEGGFTAPVNANGLWIVSRTASNVVTTYRNGSSIHTTATASVGVSGLNVVVGANAPSGVSLQGWSTDQIAMAFCASGWNSTQVGTFSTLANALMTSLGINTY